MRTTKTSSSRINLVAMLAGLSLIPACALEGEVPEEESEVEAEATGGNVVTTWAAIAADAIVRPDEATTTLRTPGPSAMLMAQVQLAVYDAMVAIYKDHYAFSYKGSASSSASKDAAAATAAYRILRTRVPGRAAFLDTQYATTMNAIAAGSSKTNGTNVGEAAAQHYLTLRAADNIDKTYTWTAATPGPGVFESAVAGGQPADYKMVFVPPFTFSLSQTTSFYPAAPPALNSPAYATAFDETRTLGGAASTVRTEAQKQLGLWSAENPFRWASRNLNELAVTKNLARMDAARFFALAYTSIADSLQTGMSAKYAYNRWRPSIAVPRADTDNNSVTVADPTWTQLLTVNHPEYPAGHGFVGAGAVVEAVRAFFRTDNVSWTLTTVGVTGLTETSRSYTSLTALANDIKDARVFAGLHFRYSMDAGQAQGKAVVQYINSKYFRARW
ncbi:MAG TPA: vanadium-dependent haloperoxidase [Kofleriaceae bacterium]|nr:vanadium-dependent haloperoxidase [Kofleriaceae bacterium]